MLEQHFCSIAWQYFCLQIFVATCFWNCYSNKIKCYEHIFLDTPLAFLLPHVISFPTVENQARKPTCHCWSATSCPSCRPSSPMPPPRGYTCCSCIVIHTYKYACIPWNKNRSSSSWSDELVHDVLLCMQMASARVLQETCSHIRSLHREVDRVGERPTEAPPRTCVSRHFRLFYLLCFLGQYIGRRPIFYIGAGLANIFRMSKLWLWYINSPGECDLVQKLEKWTMWYNKTSACVFREVPNRIFFVPANRSTSELTCTSYLLLYKPTRCF